MFPKSRVDTKSNAVGVGTARPHDASGERKRGRAVPTPFQALSFALLLLFTGCGKELSLDALKRQAESGNAKAQCELGQALLTGAKGTAINPAEAVRWLTKSSDRGYPFAQFLLAQQYLKGQGVPKNEVKAVSYFRKAAQQGIAGAQHELGVTYTLGRGAAKDFNEAVKWYRQAAEQGLADSQYCLGLRYALGQGVSVNDAEAVKWFRKAAAQGVPEAQMQMAQRCAIGEGVAKDLVEAYKWAMIVGDENAHAVKWNHNSSPHKSRRRKRRRRRFNPCWKSRRTRCRNRICCSGFWARRRLGCMDWYFTSGTSGGNKWPSRPWFPPKLLRRRVRNEHGWLALIPAFYCENG